VDGEFSAFASFFLALTWALRARYFKTLQTLFGTRTNVTAVRLKVEENQLVDVFGEIAAWVDVNCTELFVPEEENDETKNQSRERDTNRHSPRVIET
jgi:hypothetical protein